MRLIDADALLQECEYINDIPAVTERDIDNAPTIAAIPVEWLRNIKQHIPESIEKMGIDAVLILWSNEQEAQDG